jgi:hypothetical protein
MSSSIQPATSQTSTRSFGSPQPGTDFFYDVASELWNDTYLHKCRDKPWRNSDLERMLVAVIADWLRYYCWLSTSTEYVVSDIRLDTEFEVKENHRWLPRFRIIFQFLCNILTKAPDRVDEYLPSESTWRTKQRYYTVNENGKAFLDAESLRKKSYVYCAWYDLLSQNDRYQFRQHPTTATVLSGTKEANALCPVLANLLKNEVSTPLKCLSALRPETLCRNASRINDATSATARLTAAPPTRLPERLPVRPASSVAQLAISPPPVQAQSQSQSRSVSAFQPALEASLPVPVADEDPMETQAVLDFLGGMDSQ